MTINLLCHVERLPDYGTGEVYFSMNLTVGFAADPGAIGDDLKKLISPWLWEVHDIDYHLETGGVLGAKAQAQRVGTVTVDPSGTFSKKLESVRDAFVAKHKSERFVWNPGKHQTLACEGDELRWQDFLIHASTYPAALAQSAGVSLVFKVASVDAAADRLIAAPRIDLGDGVVRQPTGMPRHVEVGSTAADTPPFFYEWEYDAAIVAYQRECLLEAPTGAASDDQFLDVTGGWVTGGAGTVAEDWALRLEARLGEAFDLPMRIVAALRRKVGFEVDDNNREAVVALVTAAMHDVAATGSHRSANAPATAPDLLVHVGKALEAPAIVERIRPHLAAFEQQLKHDQWQSLLRDATSSKLFRNADGTYALGNDGVLDELLRIHGMLSDEATLRALLVAQWEAALGHDDDLLAFVRNAKDRLLLDVLPTFSLRKAFLLDVLQQSWPALSVFPKASTRAEQVKMLQNAVTVALQGYFRDRFDDVVGSYRGFHPRSVTVPAAIEAIVSSALQSFARGFVEPQAPELEPLVPRDRVDHDALLIQLADVRRADDDSTSENDQGSSARRISGYGVLLRRSTDAEWRCLNYALVVDGSSGAPLLTNPLLVPLRLGFRNGVRQTFVAYENVPLVAESPFIELMRERNALNDSLQPIEDDSVFRYRNAYGAGANQPKLVPLVFGADYETAAFAIGTAGSLPRGLAKTVDHGGTKVVDPVVADLPSAKPEGVRKVKFRRRTLVGTPRFDLPGSPSASAFKELPLPTIPPTVQPLARSLASLNGGANVPRRPLLFLRTLEQPLSNFRFAIRPPSVDIHTWDRWVAKDQDKATRDKRVLVWGKYHELANERDAGTTLRPGDRRIDLALDDPAVAGWLVRLTPSFPSGLAAIEKWIDKLEPADLLEPLDAVRHKPLVVTIATKQGGTIDFSAPAAGACAVTIPDGQVWTLEIFPAVKTADVTDRFAGDTVPNSVSGAWTLFEPFALDIETTPAAIDIPATELHEALIVTDARNPDALIVSLDPGQMPIAAPWVHRLEVVVQQWRWSGRPLVRPRAAGLGEWDLVSGFPPGADPDLNDDAVLFADRSPTDALVVPGYVDFVTRPLQAELHRRDIGNTRGALYFRVALRAFSRYEGVKVLGTTSNDSRHAAAPEAWRRHVVRCRWMAEVPPPVVKLIVPLTRPVGQGMTPPLLVVLDEPWGEVGGLAEKLTAEIVSVARTDHEIVKEALPNDASLPELGPDPILSVNRNTNALTPQPPIGPIGYTFDTDTDAPLFVKSSFILPPPAGLGDLSWYFVKLRFWREIEPGWSVAGVPPKSEPTQPVWAQYLPPSTRFGLVDVTTLTLVVDGATDTAAFRDRDGKPVTLEPTVAPGSKSVFELWVLLTNVIEDASGRLDQESPVGDPIRLTGATFAVPGKLTAPSVRILEVQRRKDVSTDGLWKDLFRDDPMEDAKARIVRVSPPVTGSSRR